MRRVSRRIEDRLATEIERKFLVESAEWLGLVTRRSRILDGLLMDYGDRKLRIRIRDDLATMAFKGPRHGISRDEYEYSIPLADAQAMIQTHCIGRVLAKTRHEVQHAGFVWEVDVYDAPLDGVVLAEIELTDAATFVPLPSWLGPEVTGQLRYRKAHMLRARMAELAGEGPG